MISTINCSKFSRFPCLYLRRFQTVKSMNFQVNIVAYTKNWTRMEAASWVIKIQFLSNSPIPEPKKFEEKPNNNKN